MSKRCQETLLVGAMAAALLLGARPCAAQQDEGGTVGPPSPAGAPGTTDDPDARSPEPAAPATPPDLGFELPTVTPGPEMTLADALAAADARSISLAAARAEIAKVDAQLGMAWAAIFPAAQGQLQYMHRDHADSFSFADSLPPSMAAPGMDEEVVIMPADDLKGTLAASMPIINLQSWMNISAARQGLQVAELTVENVRQQLLLGVAQAYLVAMMSRTLIDMRISQVESAAHHLHVASALFEAGTGLRLDVIRAETDLAQARQELLTAHLSLDNSRDALAVLTGVDGLPMPVETPPLREPEGESRQLVERAIDARTDLRAKQAMIGALEKQLDASWMQFVPTLDAAWQLQYQFTEPGDMGSQDRSRWTALLTLTVPIYNQFRYADLDLKRAALRQAMLQQEDAVQNAAVEVRSARRSYLTALSSAEIAERQAALAEEGLKLAEAAYAAGTGTSLGVTDARRTAAAAAVNVISQRLQAQMALLTLLKAIGEDMLGLAE